MDNFFTRFSTFTFYTTLLITFFYNPQIIEAQVRVDPGDCGSVYWQRAIIPDHWGNADFSVYCRRHDNCYDAGYEKTRCDDEFRTGLRRECKNTYASWAQEVQRRSCLEAANAYYEVVKRMGGDAYRESQKCNTSGRPTPNGRNMGDRIASHREMYEGDYLLSGDGRFKLVMQGDGNMVIYKQGRPIWASNTMGVDCAPYKLAMQSDGNYVIYGKNRPIWASNTNGKGIGPYILVMQNDGNLVVYDQNSPIWATNTCCH